MRGLLACSLLTVLAGGLVACGSSKSSSSAGSTVSSGGFASASAVQSCLARTNLDVRQASRAGGVKNFQVRVTSSTSPITVNLNVFPSAKPAAAYFNRVKDTLTASGGDLQLHGNVMVATSDVVLPADRPDVAPIEKCASG